MVRWIALLGLCFLRCWGADDYTLGPDSQIDSALPRGELVAMKWTNSAIYPGTSRDFWIYVPKQYDPAVSACLLVFQDGFSYLNDKGQFRATRVVDHLIARKAMPVTITLFINPGDYPPAFPGAKSRGNRSFEYDSLGERYALFLKTEILPVVEKQYNISKEPKHRAIAGISSGGICAFTVAWEHPEMFGKVLSNVGSFTNIRGGNEYPSLVRKGPKREIKVFLQDGTGDLDNLHGNWPLANQLMAKALEFRKYDYKFVLGDGGHNGKHGGAILPESLTWLWSDVVNEAK